MVNTTETEEDYLKAILNITENKGFARTKDVAKALGVRPATTVEMLKKLEEKGLIKREHYGPTVLTEKGTKIATITMKKHKVLLDFFKMILVPEEEAEKDACDMEHNLSKVTNEQLIKFMAFLSHEGFFEIWEKKFKDFSSSGKLKPIKISNDEYYYDLALQNMK
ncbi:MAG: metal-dependent transcriptional regulator [Candidatus Methanofastidiosum sp.]|nr:metal-dependent transcriptional regulator [Methanofastidiosum sp.]NYT04013.1 metal-dependent transcriptional regulator [Candidatus Methanofastidiosa archaeon]NYT13450.1 metal-dependent transcriptional regulator [Candidatus Methanofastidiosa archaeon]